MALASEVQISVEEDELKPDQPIYKNGRYNNPWDTWTPPKLSIAALKFFLNIGNRSNIPSKKEELNRTLPVIKPDLKQFDVSPARGIRFMWVGHASCLVQMDGITFLTDPVFSDRCSPVQWAGVKRYRPTPCTIEELPKIDAVLISHNHYDHLDLNSVKALNRRFQENCRWYVPMGQKPWFNDRGCTNVVELTWWQDQLHSEESQVHFALTPCQHWCKRTLCDDNRVLWGSWCVIGPRHRFYFSGDTGYCSTFPSIGKRYGPFDLATIPIGAYSPRDFLKPQHTNPSEAVDIHREIRARQSIGIHWGTFDLSQEFYLEPRDKLKAEVEKRGMAPWEFITVKHGEVAVYEVIN